MIFVRCILDVIGIARFLYSFPPDYIIHLVDIVSLSGFVYDR
jgi:hypothetical protein